MADHTDTEHLSELTSSSNEQERLPETIGRDEDECQPGDHPYYGCAAHPVWRAV